MGTGQAAFRGSMIVGSRWLRRTAVFYVSQPISLFRNRHRNQNRSSATSTPSFAHHLIFLVVRNAIPPRNDTFWHSSVGRKRRPPPKPSRDLCRREGETALSVFILQAFQHAVGRTNIICDSNSLTLWSGSIGLGTIGLPLCNSGNHGSLWADLGSSARDLGWGLIQIHAIIMAARARPDR
jgi:hypothetical protein